MKLSVGWGRDARGLDSTWTMQSLPGVFQHDDVERVISADVCHERQSWRVAIRFASAAPCGRHSIGGLLSMYIPGEIVSRHRNTFLARLSVTTCYFETQRFMSRRTL